MVLTTETNRKLHLHYYASSAAKSVFEKKFKKLAVFEIWAVAFADGVAADALGGEKKAKAKQDVSSTAINLTSHQSFPRKPDNCKDMFNQRSSPPRTVRDMLKLQSDIPV